MNCIFPPELTDLQLMAYLDKPESNQETASHLEKCPHCQEKAKALELFQKHLKTRLYRSTCPSSEQLGEYYLRMAPANQRLAIAQHLRECPHCASEINTLTDFLKEESSQPEPVKSLRTVFAKLVSGAAGAGSQQTFPALRGQAKDLPIFEGEGIVITIDLQDNPDGQVSILGQLAADDQDQWTGATVELKQAYVSPLVTSLDDLGSFTFETLYPISLQISVTSQQGIAVETEKVFIAI
jgi:hypothetical protein